MAQNKYRTELVGLYHFAEELAKLGYLPLLTTRNAKGIDMVVSNATGSKSLTFQVKTIQLEDEKQDSFPVFSAPSDDSKSHVKSWKDMLYRIRESIQPSETKWWAFIPVKNLKVGRYYLVPSKDVNKIARTKTKDYLKIKKGKITGLVKKGKKKGQPYTWGSAGVIGLYIEDLKPYGNGLTQIKRLLRR